MKKKLVLLLAAALLLPLAVSVWPRLAAEELSMKDRGTVAKLDSIMQGFYLAPQPEKVDEFLKLAAECKAIGNAGARCAGMVFLGEIFRRNPQHLRRWTGISGSDAFKGLVLSALYYANTPESTAVGRELSGDAGFGSVPSRDASEFPPERFPTEMLDGCWGGFFATGERRYVDAVIKVALLPEEPTKINLTERSAVWSLLSLMEKHPKVKEYFREYLRGVYPQTRYALAKRISESMQRELLGKVLITDEAKDADDTEAQKRRPFSAVREAARLKPDFFAAVEKEMPSCQSDFIARLQPLVVKEVLRRFPELSAEEAGKIALGHITLRDATVPRKFPFDETGGFLNFYAISKYVGDLKHPITQRQEKMFLDYGLKLAAKYPDELVVAQMVLRECGAAYAISRFEPKMLKRRRVHPYLEMMLMGDYWRNRAWRERGGGYADTVPTHGWQSFRENLNKARAFYERAWQQYPRAPEAPARMVGLTGALSGGDGEMILWLNRALAAQKDYPEAASLFAWYSRPRWGGSAAQLLADAKAFLRQRKADPVLAYNGLLLLEAFLSETPFIDGIRYFRGEANYEEVKELFENLAEAAPLTPAQKLFFGTVALLADDHETADEIAASLSAEEVAAAPKNLRRRTIPAIGWIDFPALNRALNRAHFKSELFRAVYTKNADAVAALLKPVIAKTSDSADKQSLIDFYIMLKGDLDLTSYARGVPAFIRLCGEFDEAAEQVALVRELTAKGIDIRSGADCDRALRKAAAMGDEGAKRIALIREAVAMGTDVNVLSPRGTVSPLYYALRSKVSGELLEILLAAKVDPYVMWGDHTPLDYAVHANFPPERIRRFLESGVDPNRKYNKTFTPLHASFRNLEGTKLLVEFGARLNEVSEFGHTPLDLAEKMGSAEVVRFLRSKGAKRAREL